MCALFYYYLTELATWTSRHFYCVSLCMAFRLYILITTINCFLCAVYSACDQNVCQNGGTCSQHIFEYICECTPAYCGSFCEMSTSEWTSVYVYFSSNDHELNYEPFMACMYWDMASKYILSIVGAGAPRG